MLFGVSSQASLAQWTPVTTNIKTPYGNVPHSHYVYSPRFYYHDQEAVSAKYEFFIVLKNDSLISGTSRIDLPEKKWHKHSITFKDKKTKIETTIYPRDTKSIYRMTVFSSASNAEKKKIAGIPADTCWLFKSYWGKINAYSFVAELGLTYAIAIQRGNDSPIVPLTKENLAVMVGTGNERINKLIRKNKLTKAIELYNEE